MFQSTPPRRGRHENLFTFYLRHVVSIHAPAQGATIIAPYINERKKRFNPRPRAGGDALNLPHSIETDSFNPRPRAGGDPNTHTCCCRRC